jgi:O-antigen/teichoic acid export membrane protein
MSLRLSSVYVSISAFIRLAVSLVSIPVLVQFLGLERYGIWVVLNSVIAIGALVELGLSTALTNHVSADCAREDWISAGRNLATSLVLMTCLGVLVAVGLWCASPLLSSVLFADGSGREEALLALGMMSWLLLPRLWQQWAMAAEAALLRYDFQAAVESTSTVIMQAGVLLLAFARCSSLVVLAGWSLVVTSGSLIAHCLVLKHLFRNHPLRLRCSWRATRTLFRFGVMQWLSGLGSALFGQVDRIIINFFLGSTAAGLYSAATSVVVKINALSAIPLRVLPPAVSAANALSRKSRVQQLFIQATRLNGVGVCIIAFPILFWAYPLARTLVGQEYANQTAELLRTLAFIYGLYSLAAAGYFTAIGIGYPNLNARWGLTGGVLTCVMLVILAPRTRLIEVVWANAAYVLTLITNLQVMALLRLDLWVYLKAFLPSVCMMILWWLLSNIIATLPGLVWIKIVMFLTLGLVSVFLVSGLALLQDIVEVPLIVMKRLALRKRVHDIIWKR